MSNHVNSLITEIDVSNPPKRKIFVGHIGETGFRKIVFLVGSWKEEFPTGTPTLVFKRADGKTYPVNLNQNASGDPVFTPSSTETAFAGDCVIQLRWTQNGVLGKTCDLPASVESAIGSVGPLPDDDVRDYEAEISANTNARHIHSNKNVLDGITAQKVSMWDEGGNVDKAAIIANTNARHTHNNKNVLDGITAQKVSKWDEGGTVDSELSSASTSPVQNKVVKAALDTKADVSALSAKQDALTAGQNITISGNTISADVDPTEIASNVTDWLDANVDPVGSAVVVDSSLSVEGAAADAKATGDAIAAASAHSGLTEEVKQALLDCFENVAWVNEDGQDYYDALYAALYPPVDVLSISAVFTQGSAVIYTDDSLDTLKQYLVVTATMADNTTQTVTNYTLSGTLTVGTSTITVSYGGKTDTFTVAVSEQKLYQLCEYVETDGASRIDTGVQFDGTKDIEVTVEASFAKALRNGEYTQFGWSAGGSIGVIYGYFGGETVSAWTDGASNPSTATHLSGINLMTEINMVIQAGSATNTISTFTNTNGTKTLTRAHTNVENRTFLPFPLFALSLQDSFDYTLDGFRIKSAIIKVGGTVVRNMKACYRKSDNVIGFFDETNSVFYTNAGTGTFTKGGDIS